MAEQMVLKNEEGKETICDIVAMWKSNNNKYIAYTDGSKDKEGALELFVSKYKKENEVLTMMPILDETEWNSIDEYLDKNIFNNTDL